MSWARSSMVPKTAVKTSLKVGICTGRGTTACRAVLYYIILYNIYIYYANTAYIRHISHANSTARKAAASQTYMHAYIMHNYACARSVIVSLKKDLRRGP